MSRLTPAIILLSCFAVTGALAQTGGQGTGATTGAKSSGVLPAPVGHRQPTRSEVGPNATSNNGNAGPTDAEDKALDRKIKSICRGC
jgi:hypothetical protein